MSRILFSIQKYQYLMDKVAQIVPYEKGIVEVKYFPDGERYQRILSDVDGKNVILIGGSVTDQDTLEMYDLACALVKYGANSLTMIIPYFGYSTMERMVQKGEIVTAKTRARIFSVIPSLGKGNKIIMIDLHSEGIPHYFEGNLRTIHLYAKSVILKAVKEIASENFVLACTDAGRAKWVESLANDIKVNAAFVFKRRISGEETAVTSISADVKNKDVIIYDDMIRTGGSLIHAAEAYKNAGANKIYAITTHGIFANNSIEKLAKTKLFEKIIATDTHPNVLAINHPILEVKSVAPLLAETLMKL